MKRLLRLLLIIMVIGTCSVLAGCSALTLYYRSNFPINTWINGVYCTGKTVEQVNRELISAQESSVIYVIDAGRNHWEIDMEEADVMPDYIEALTSCLERDEPLYWLEYLKEPLLNELTVVKYCADEEKLRDCFESLPFVVKERDRKEGVLVCYSEEGYFLQDDNKQHLNREKAYACLKKCLSMGQTRVDLLEEGCYEDLPDSDADKLQRELWKQIGDFTDRCSRLAYDMGTEMIFLRTNVVAHFLETESGSNSPKLDGQGNLMISESKVREWVEQLALAYDTCGTKREFVATRGDIVMVEYVTYGTKIDVETETVYLLEALKEKSTENEVHIPAYIQQGYVRGLDDIGGTYIEIDMTGQKMYYYVEGELALETDVVTGNMSKRMGTPAGINFVRSKNRNTVLSGPGYSSFVKYWVPVKGGIGIHDASWRSTFGGNIYKTDGSHGCINTPTDIMAQLYDMIEVGMPVIMFY